MDSQDEFTAVPDLDLPEGAPVTGYKLVYHASNGKYYPYMNRDPWTLESSIMTGASESFDTPYNTEGVSTLPPQDGMPTGYYYWADKGIAEDYAKWASPQPSHHSTTNLNTVVVGEGEEWHYKEMPDGTFAMPGATILPWYDKESPASGQVHPKQTVLMGRYELVRVEGEHVPKTANWMDEANEGHVMNNMKIYPEPLMVFNIRGQKLDTIEPFDKYIAQQRPYLTEGKVEQTHTHYYY